MRADDAGWAREIVRVVAAGGGCDLGDGNGGRVGGENGVWGADPSELGEDGRFQRRDFGDGFDDEVNGREVRHLCGCGEPLPGGGGFRLGESVFGHVFREELVLFFPTRF